MTRDRPALPASSANTLRELYAATCTEGFQQANERFDGYCWALRANGWTLQAIADGVGLSRERVRQRLLTAEPVAGLPPVPLPPPRRVEVARPQPKLRVRDEVAAELRAMHAVARTVTGGTPVDDPRRAVSVEFSARLADLNAQGVSVYELAQVVGVSRGAIQLRLSRHGYRPMPPSQHISYQGVQSQAYNRAKRRAS